MHLWYDDPRFDDANTVHYTVQMTVGPQRRIKRFWLRAKAIRSHPGWHFVHMFADNVASVDCSSSDVSSTIAALETCWRGEVRAQHGSQRSGDLDEMGK